MNSLYKIVFRSIAPNADEQTALTAFAKTFKLPMDTAEKILSKPIILKKDISAQKAQTYKHHLAKIGILIDIKPMVEATKSNSLQTHIEKNTAIELENTEKGSAAQKPKKPSIASGGLSLVEEPDEPEVGDPKPVTQNTKSEMTGINSNLTLEDSSSSASQSSTQSTQQKTQNSQSSYAPQAPQANKPNTSQQSTQQASKQDKDALVYDDPIELPFEFKGDGFEYFKIWIVNILLTIVTLGVYSAWAKVRDNRYFYANTFLDEHNFEYHANPKKILIGRIILVVIVLLMTVLSTLAPVLAIFIALLWGIALPFFIHQGIRFKLAYSSYRNVRFHFERNLKESYISFLALPFISVFTLYLLYPFAIFKQRKFLIDNANFGTSQFSSDFSAGEVYKICIFTVVGFIVSSFLGFSLFGAPLAIGKFGFMTMLSIILFFLIPAACYWFYYISMRNLVMSSTSLDMNSLYSDIDFKQFIFIKATNYLGIIFTLGLFYPWARVRLARFLADNTFLNSMENLNNYTANQTQDVDATGSEVVDYIDFDFGF